MCVCVMLRLVLLFVVATVDALHFVGLKSEYPGASINAVEYINPLTNEVRHIWPRRQNDLDCLERNHTTGECLAPVALNASYIRSAAVQEWRCAHFANGTDTPMITVVRMLYDDPALNITVATFPTLDVSGCAAQQAEIVRHQTHVGVLAYLQENGVYRDLGVMLLTIGVLMGLNVLVLGYAVTNASRRSPSQYTAWTHASKCEKVWALMVYGSVMFADMRTPAQRDDAVVLTETHPAGADDTGATREELVFTPRRDLDYSNTGSPNVSEDDHEEVYPEVDEHVEHTPVVCLTNAEYEDLTTSLARSQDGLQRRMDSFNIALEENRRGVV